jgi:hypothetical protein
MSISDAVSSMLFFKSWQRYRLYGASVYVNFIKISRKISGSRPPLCRSLPTHRSLTYFHTIPICVTSIAKIALLNKVRKNPQTLVPEVIYSYAKALTTHMRRRNINGPDLNQDHLRLVLQSTRFHCWCCFTVL